MDKTIGTLAAHETPTPIATRPAPSSPDDPPATGRNDTPTVRTKA